LSFQGKFFSCYINLLICFIRLYLRVVALLLNQVKFCGIYIDFDFEFVVW
jgi:hypothetical protein